MDEKNKKDEDLRLKKEQEAQKKEDEKKKKEEDLRLKKG